MTVVLSLALICCAGLLIFYRVKSQRIMNSFDKMMDEAINGDFEADTYDESRLSKLEVKLSRFLSVSKLKKKQIEEEQQNIRSLISDISHQTKTPISNVLLYSQLLAEQENLPKDMRAYVERVTAGAEKLSFLVQALVKASRLETGIIEISPQKGDLRRLILAALKDCDSKAKEKSVELAHVSLSRPIWGIYDPKWCTEALYNILDNAVKYTEAGGRVEVTITQYDFFARIDVADTGRGIKEEDITKVFGRFWRATESANDEGIGIGLYLSREIIAACGGYIKVKSAKNEGAVFSVFLPVN